MSNRVLLVGYYGGNFGDLLMLVSLIDYLLKNSIEVNVLSYDDVSREIIEKYPSVSFFSLKHGSIYYRLKVFNQAKHSCGSIMWGGGTCFMDEGGTGALKYMFLAKLFGMKVFYVGVGIGNAKKISTKFYVYFAGFLSSGFFVRDVYSAAKLPRFSAGKVELMPDLAYGFSAAAAVNDAGIDEHEYFEVLVAYRDLSDYVSRTEESIIIENLIVRLRELPGLHAKIRFTFMSVDEEIDREKTEYLADAMADRSKTRLILSATLAEKTQVIRRSHLVVTGRLHVALMADKFGKKFFLINYSPKNEIFLKNVGKLSSLIDYEDLNKAGLLVNREIDNPTTHSDAHDYDTELNRSLEKLVEML